MANSLDLKELSLNVEFKDRVRVNLTFIAHQIVGEDNATADTEIRQSYGRQIVNNVDNFVHRFSQGVVTEANIAQKFNISGGTLNYTGSQTPTTEFDAADVEIQTGLSAVYNDMAGVLNLP